MTAQENIPFSLSTFGMLTVLLLASLALPLNLARADPAVPSLEEVLIGLSHRQDKIQGIYIEAHGETTIPLAAEDFDKLPEYIRNWVGTEVQYYYAAQGEKRYSRKIEPVGVWDHVRAYNETSVWERVKAEDHPDGKPMVVKAAEADNLDRFIYPNRWSAVNLGAVISGPSPTPEHAWQEQDIRHFYAPDLTEQWSLRVLDKLEEVEGASCVVLAGTIERTFTENQQPRKRVRHIRFWLDRDHGWTLRKWEEGVTDQEISLRLLTSDLHESDHKVWVPRKIEIQVFATPGGIGDDLPKQLQGKQVLTTRIQVTKCQFGNVADEIFDPK